MRRFRKIAGLMLVLVMALAMSVTVMAASTTYTITINSTTSGHTYEAYQIFTGDLSGSGTTSDPYVLSNIEWGSGVDTTSQVDSKTLLQALQALTVNSSTPFASCTDAASVAEVLSTYTDNSDVVKTFAEVVSNYLTTTATGTSTENKDASDNTLNYTISGLSAGYYLVKDQDNSLSSSNNEDDAYTMYILEVLGNVEANPKDDVPSLDKEILSSTTDANYETTADYDIGDSVPFTLTATLPSTYSAYETYKLVFHDTMSTGLTFNSSSVEIIVVDGTTGSTLTTLAPTSYTVSPSTDTAGATIEISIEDLKKLGTFSAGDKVVVTYTATLNDNATTIEYNNAYLEYSNNPNGSGEGNTTKDKTYVVTFELNVYKTDGDGNALTGAQFTLYKDDGSDKYTEVVGGTAMEATEYQAVAITEFAEGVTYYTLDGGVYSEVTDTSSGPVSGTIYYVKSVFVFEGLAVGKYKLVETTTPAGYNIMNP